MIPSLGSPLVFERNGMTFIRTGCYVAPLDLLITAQDSIATWLHEGYEEHLKISCKEGGDSQTFDEFCNYHICAGGFVDLRPLAILCTSSQSDLTHKGAIKRLLSADELRDELLKIEPYSVFTTCGLVALMFRLRGLHNHLLEAMAELGTLHEFRWQMPRDSNGHILLVPGAVEAFRMVAEGLEKSTGTEGLDGIWGYERRPVPERWDIIPGINRDTT